MTLPLQRTQRCVSKANQQPVTITSHRPQQLTQILRVAWGAPVAAEPLPEMMVAALPTKWSRMTTTSPVQRRLCRRWRVGGHCCTWCCWMRLCHRQSHSAILPVRCVGCSSCSLVAIVAVSGDRLRVDLVRRGSLALPGHWALPVPRSRVVRVAMAGVPAEPLVVVAAVALVLVLLQAVLVVAVSRQRTLVGHWRAKVIRRVRHRQLILMFR